MKRKDRGDQKVEKFTGDADVKRSQRGPALGGHDARDAERGPPSQEQKEIMLTVIDHTTL